MSFKKILVADDHPIFRKGISALLKDTWPNLEIIEAASGLDIIQRYQTNQPDLLIYRLQHAKAEWFYGCRSTPKEE